MNVADRTVTERKLAGASLLSRLRMALLERDARDWSIGRIGGFDLTASIQRDFIGREGVPTLLMQRTDYDHAITVQNDLTALGLIARLEHVLEHFEEDLETQTRHRADAIARLDEVEADLARTDSIIADDQPGLTEGDGITQAG